MAKYLTSQLDSSPYGTSGMYDEESQYQYIFPRSKRVEDVDRGVLVIGAAGAGGIEFVMKPEHQAIYAFYPIEQKSRKIAENFNEFIEGWTKGNISV